MNKSGAGFPAILLVAMIGLCGMTSVVAAQDTPTRRDTGRHRPPPQPPERPDREGELDRTNAGRTPWFIGLGAGVLGSGDLWRLETISGAAVPWVATAPFSSSRFSATLSNNVSAGLFVGRRVGPWGAVRLDLSSSRMDIGAEALQGQQGSVFLYDRLTVTTVGLAAEVRLALLASYPYVSAGAVWRRLSAAREYGLDQGRLGWQLGLGYLRALNPVFSLRAEARYSRIGFEMGDFRPLTAFASQPELEIDPADTLHFFAVVLAVQLNL